MVGGILHFLLGYVFYGLLLKNFMDNNGMAVNMDNIVWWAMIVGSFTVGFLLSYILIKGSVSTASGGATTGFIVGLLMSLSFDLLMYSLGKGMSLKGIAGDVAAAAVMTAIIGAVVAYVLGMSRKPVAAA